MTEIIRVIHDDPCDGPTNMARDEVLLGRVGSGESLPTLRLYHWSIPTISLGYFQPFSEYQELPPPAGDLPVVRRPTGGGAILHDQELTYSFTVPTAHRLAQPPIARLYTAFHNALIEVMDRMGVKAEFCGETGDSGVTKGPFFCFARRHELDLLVGSEKLVGSAQRRTRDAVLQHGSIIVQRRFDQQISSAVADHCLDSTERLAEHFVTTLAKRENLTFCPGSWTSDELAEVPALAKKHRSPEWIRRK